MIAKESSSGASRPAVMTAALAAMVTAGPGLNLHAEGFRSPTIGTVGLATSGGRIAFVDDASAAQHNPANLTAFETWQVSAEPTIVHHTVEYTSPSGARAETKDPWKFLPHVFAGGPLVKDKWALGIGITVPYGLSINWEENGALRYAAPHKSQLDTFNFNPSIAFRAHERLSFAVGLDVMWSRLELRQHFPWFLVVGFPTPDGLIKAEGDGIGWGANAAVTWRFHQQHRLAFTARTPMDVDYDGDISLSNVPGDPVTSQTARLKSGIDFPTILSAGYGFQPSSTVRLEANVEWVQFSRFETLKLTTSAPIAGVPPELKQNWKDTYTIGVAGSWEFQPGWFFRLGYQHYQTPVPDFTFQPSIPDADQNVVTAGLGFRSGHHRLEAAYARVFYDDRDIAANQNLAYLGRYEIAAHLISVAYGYSF